LSKIKTNEDPNNRNDFFEGESKENPVSPFLESAMDSGINPYQNLSLEIKAGSPLEFRYEKKKEKEEINQDSHGFDCVGDTFDEN
jgi:hypothetical protein